MIALIVLTLLAVALATLATPVAMGGEPAARIVLKKHVTGTDLVANDHARAKHLLSRDSTYDTSFTADISASSTLINNRAVGYTVSLKVGN